MAQKIFKAEAEGDTMYFGAEDLQGARDQFHKLIGDVPSGIVTWSEVDELPEGEELA